MILYRIQYKSNNFLAPVSFCFCPSCVYEKKTGLCYIFPESLSRLLFNRAYFNGVSVIIEDLQCGMVGVSWSIGDGVSLSVEPTSPTRDKPI